MFHFNIICSLVLTTSSSLLSTASLFVCQISHSFHRNGAGTC